MIVATAGQDVIPRDVTIGYSTYQILIFDTLGFLLSYKEINRRITSCPLIRLLKALDDRNL